MAAGTAACGESTGEACRNGDVAGLSLMGDAGPGVAAGRLGVAFQVKHLDDALQAVGPSYDTTEAWARATRTSVHHERRPSAMRLTRAFAMCRASSGYARWPESGLTANQPRADVCKQRRS